MSAGKILLVVALSPFVLMLVGGGLSELLACTGGPDRVSKCAALPGAEPLVTFLTVYMGWLFVFNSIGCFFVWLIILAVRSFSNRR